MGFFWQYLAFLVNIWLLWAVLIKESKIQRLKSNNLWTESDQSGLFLQSYVTKITDSFMEFYRILNNKICQHLLHIANISQRKRSGYRILWNFG